MFELVFRAAFKKSFKKLEVKFQEQIKNKIFSLKTNQFLGKRLSGYPYWSIHIGQFRIIYEIHSDKNQIELIEILKRKHDYSELKRL